MLSSCIGSLPLRSLSLRQHPHRQYRHHTCGPNLPSTHELTYCRSRANHRNPNCTAVSGFCVPMYADHRNRPLLLPIVISNIRYAEPGYPESIHERKIEAFGREVKGKRVDDDTYTWRMQSRVDCLSPPRPPRKR